MHSWPIWGLPSSSCPRPADEGRATAFTSRQHPTREIAEKDRTLRPASSSGDRKLPARRYPTTGRIRQEAKTPCLHPPLATHPVVGAVSSSLVPRTGRTEPVSIVRADSRPPLPVCSCAPRLRGKASTASPALWQGRRAAASPLLRHAAAPARRTIFHGRPPLPRENFAIGRLDDQSRITINCFRIKIQGTTEP